MKAVSACQLSLLRQDLFTLLGQDLLSLLEQDLLSLQDLIALCKTGLVSRGAGRCVAFETKTPTNHVPALLAPSWFFLPLPRPIIHVQCSRICGEQLSGAPPHMGAELRY